MSYFKRAKGKERSFGIGSCSQVVADADSKAAGGGVGPGSCPCTNGVLSGLIFSGAQHCSSSIPKKSQIGTDAGLSAPFPHGVGSAPAAGEGRERRWWGFAFQEWG